MHCLPTCSKNPPKPPAKVKPKTISPLPPNLSFKPRLFSWGPKVATLEEPSNEPLVHVIKNTAPYKKVQQCFLNQNFQQFEAKIDGHEKTLRLHEEGLLDQAAHYKKKYGIHLLIVRDNKTLGARSPLEKILEDLALKPEHADTYHGILLIPNKTRSPDHATCLICHVTSSGSLELIEILLDPSNAVSLPLNVDALYGSDLTSIHFQKDAEGLSAIRALYRPSIQGISLWVLRDILLDLQKHGEHFTQVYKELSKRGRCLKISKEAIGSDTAVPLTWFFNMIMDPNIKNPQALSIPVPRHTYSKNLSKQIQPLSIGSYLSKKIKDLSISYELHTLLGNKSYLRLSNSACYQMQKNITTHLEKIRKHERNLLIPTQKSFAALSADEKLEALRLERILNHYTFVTTGQKFVEGPLDVTVEFPQEAPLACALYKGSYQEPLNCAYLEREKRLLNCYARSP